MYRPRREKTEYPGGLRKKEMMFVKSKRHIFRDSCVEFIRQRAHLKITFRVRMVSGPPAKLGQSLLCTFQKCFDLLFDVAHVGVVAE